MSRDYENLYDLENMGDDELKDLVLQKLAEYPQIDLDLIEVEIKSGRVFLSGRVGTEQELQQIEKVLTDVLGVGDVDNDLVVDEIVRGQRAEAADDAWAEDYDGGSVTAGGRARTTDEADHLVDNVPADQFGTTDPQEAVERGTTYSPPDHPVQEGSSREQH